MYRMKSLINLSGKATIALFFIVLTAGFSGCSKQEEEENVTFHNTFLITNTSQDGSSNARVTFTIWANGNVGGEKVKDGDYWLYKGEFVLVEVSVTLPPGVSPEYLLTAESDEAGVKDLSAATSTYPSSTPKVENGDMIKWNTTDNFVTVVK